MFKLILSFCITFFLFCKIIVNQSFAEEFIRSHEAVYSLALQNVADASRIHSLDGIMKISLKKTCDGWIFDQHTEMDVADRMGNQAEREFRYSTWESANHKKFRFLSVSSLGDEVVSHTEGYAYLGEEYGEIIFEYPKKLSVDISSYILFPMNHFKSVIKQSENDFMSNDMVFSGEDENSLYLVTAIKKYLTGKKLIKVRLAYFSLSNFSEWPENETELLIHENGLVDSVIFNYISYEIKGTLLEYKYLKEPDC